MNNDQKPLADKILETELIDQQTQLRLLIDVIDNQLRFTQELGMNVVFRGEPSIETAAIHLPWNDKLMGNPQQKILHGGVTATMLDTIGGLVIMMDSIRKKRPRTLKEFNRSIRKSGTIDMRIDYLRPGKGDLFIATGSIIRSGATVAVCRTELHNEKGVQIAYGTCTYITG